jgi:LPS-assembly lipoprotein
LSSKSIKITLLAPLVIVAGLAGCGYEPIYSEGGAATALRGQVDVQAPTTVISYRMVQELESRIGRSATPAYSLTYTLAVKTESQAITADNATVRYTLVGELDYVLKGISGADVLGSGTVEEFVGYSAAGNSLETLSSERDAEQRLAVSLANALTTRLYGTIDPATLSTPE